MKNQTVIDTIKNDRDDMWFAIGNYLDEFYYSLSKEERQIVLNEEPVWYDGVGDYEKAFFSAMVNKLAVDYNLQTPAWVYNDEYFQLEKPHFAMDAKGDLRLVLLVESPKQFRMRNIFTTSNVLSRA